MTNTEISQDRSAMEDKDRFDRFFQLAQFRLKRWESRQTYMWKITLGLWGLLAATAYYVPHRPNMWFVGFLLTLTFALYAWFFAGAILARADEDMATAFHYMDKAERELDANVAVHEKPIQQRSTRRFLFSELPKRRREKRNMGISVSVFQVSATLILMLATAYMLSTK